MDETKFDDRILVRLQSDNKEASMSLSIFKSIPSIVLFENNNDAKGPSLKLSLGSRLSYGVIPHYINKLRQSADPTNRYELTFTSYDRESKKASTLATMVFGRDDKTIPFIGVTSPKLKNSLKFSLRPSLVYDLKDVSVEEQNKIVLDEFIHIFKVSLPNAILITDESSEMRRKRMATSNNNRRSQSDEDKIPF